ncbi:MAG: hypothetical protein FOGNACKC_00808 [Anaerolineae bacterium]|nr:hypothetical protein [Anaerolineae bacterium]
MMQGYMVDAPQPLRSSDYRVMSRSEVADALGDDAPCPNCGAEQLKTQDGVTQCYACGWQKAGVLHEKS